MMKPILIFAFVLASSKSYGQLMDPRFLPVAPPQEAAAQTEEPIDSISAEEEGGYYVKRPVGQKAIVVPEKKPRKIQQPQKEKIPQQAKQEQSSVPENPNFGQKMQDILLGGDLEKIENARALFEKNDVRKNLFDLSIGTFYFYNHSQSNYYYRNYLSSAPGAFVNLDLWITPYLGFNANYKFTLLNSIKDSPFTETYATANHDWLSFGLKFRRFFSSEFETSSFSIDLNYVDKKMDVPLDSSYRMKIRSRGPQISFNLITPSSKFFLWDFAINIQPYILHEELIGTSNFSAGTGNQTLGFGASIGGEYRMSRKIRTFFKFSAELYRSQFSGSALATDPISNATPSNVTVNDAHYFFNIGLIFGH